MITEKELTMWLSQRTLTDPAQKVARYDRLLDELRNAWDLLAKASSFRGQKRDLIVVDGDEEKVDEAHGPEIGLPEMFGGTPLEQFLTYNDGRRP